MAAQQLSSLLEYYPDDVQASLELGKLYLSAGQTDPKFFQEVQKLAQNILSKDPKNVAAIVMMGNAAAGSTVVDRNLDRITVATAVIRMANAAGLSLKELVESDIQFDGGRAALQPEETLVPHYRDPEAMATAIGPRTRAYRMRENWSRRKFIEHAKISKGMLHYIESSTVEPSVAMVERLATAFSMSFSEFVEVVESPVIAIARSSDNGQQLLHHFDSTERVELDDFRLAGRQRVSTPTAPPGSTAMLYVVEGTIRVSFESEHHLLQNGDAIHGADYNQIFILN